MTRPFAGARAIAATCALALMAAGCTNVEDSHPEGWQAPDVETVPEIAALVPEDIAASGTLRGGTNPPFAPFEFKDNDGAIIGFEMDLVQAASQVLGLEFQPVEQDFPLILPALDAGTVDIGASGFTDTPERRETYDFVNFLYAGLRYATPAGGESASVDLTHDADDLCGKTVSVQRTTVGEMEIHPIARTCEDRGEDRLEVLSYDTADNAAMAVLMGRADAYLHDSPVVGWAVARSEDKMRASGEIFDAAPYGWAVPKDGPLGEALAQALQYLIDEGIYSNIIERWGIDDGLLDRAMINEQSLPTD